MFTSLAKAINQENKAKLKFTDKDNIYTSFRKTADYLAKITNFSDIAVEEAILELEKLYLCPKTILFVDFTNEELEIVNFIQRMEKYPVKPLKVEYTTKEPGTKILTEFILLDLDDKYRTKNGRFYYYPQYPDFKFRYMSYSRAYGYATILREMANSDIDLYESNRLYQYIKNLTYGDGNKFKSRWSLDEIIPEDEWNAMPRFDEIKTRVHGSYYSDKEVNPRVILRKSISGNIIGYKFCYESTRNNSIEKNKILNRLSDFLNRAYFWSLQLEYNRTQEKFTRSPVWTDKQHINSGTIAAMKSDPMNRFFAHLELDNAVDLVKVRQFSKEVCLLMENFLPVLPDTPTLRLRKLGNHRALGMYVAGIFNTIVVDFRADEDFKNFSTLSGVGVQSFVHEYGHFIDFKYSDTLLSQSQEFSKILREYQESLTEFAEENALNLKLEYLLTPTEVFARAWEIYLMDLGLVTPLMKPTTVYETHPEYAAFKGLKSEIFMFFDSFFPELKNKVKLLNNLQSEPKIIPNQIQNDFPLKEVRVGDITSFVLDI